LKLYDPPQFFSRQPFVEVKWNQNWSSTAKQVLLHDVENHKKTTRAAINTDIYTVLKSDKAFNNKLKKTNKHVHFGKRLLPNK